MKQRLQQCCSPYKSAWNCANTVYRTEGLGAFYRSYTTILTMNIPFQVTGKSEIYKHIGEYS